MQTITNKQYLDIKKIVESFEDHKTKCIFVLPPYIFFKCEKYAYNHKGQKPLKVKVVKTTNLEVITESPSFDGVRGLMNWCDKEEEKIKKHNPELKDSEVIFPDSPLLAGVKFKRTKINVGKVVKELDSLAPTIPRERLVEISELSDKELYPDTYEVPKQKPFKRKEL